MNKLCKQLSVCALLMAFGSLHADEEKNVSVFVKKIKGDEANIELKINDQLSTFTMPELEEGEVRTITTDSGKTFTVSKDDGVLKIVDADGEIIRLPPPGKNHLVAKVRSFTESEEIHKEDTIRIMATGLSEDQKETIKASISAAGIVKPVEFIDQRKMIFITKSGEDGVDIEHEVEIEMREGKKQHVRVFKEDKN